MLRQIGHWFLLDTSLPVGSHLSTLASALELNGHPVLLSDGRVDPVRGGSVQAGLLLEHSLILLCDFLLFLRVMVAVSWALYLDSTAAASLGR